jgi:hypothetical protein
LTNKGSGPFLLGREWSGAGVASKSVSADLDRKCRAGDR